MHRIETEIEEEIEIAEIGTGTETETEIFIAIEEIEDEVSNKDHIKDTVSDIHQTIHNINPIVKSITCTTYSLSVLD